MLTLLWATVAAAAAGGAPAPDLVQIPPGPFISGSDAAEREAAYRLDEKAYGHSNTRKWGWYDREPPRATKKLAGYCIMRTPVTNAQYQLFVQATGHPAPDVSPATWRGYKLIHPYERTRRHAWSEGNPPIGRKNHPVVMVSYADAHKYAAWLTKETGVRFRIPTGDEWEKAVRGTDGRRFPWGDDYDGGRLNSHDAGPFDTMPVGSFKSGAGPFDLLDGAGQVFEWTSDPAGEGRHLVRGGSWDDSGCGVCRPAARHGRPDRIKHILVGIRLAADTCGPAGREMETKID